MNRTTSRRPSPFLRVLPFLGMALAIAATTFGICLAVRSADEASLRFAVEDIEADCDDQLTLLLHIDAWAFADLLDSTNVVSDSMLRQLSEDYSVDEVTLVGADGRICRTTAPGVKAGDTFFADEGLQAPYRDLQNGRCLTVRQRFRPSTTHPGRLMKYFGKALPGGRFLQIGYLWETFEKEFARLFLPIFEERRLGDSGFCVVLDDRDIVCVNVPGHPRAKGRTAAEIGFTSANLAVPLGQIFCARLFGTSCRCLAYPETIARRRVFAVEPLSESRRPAIALSVGVALVLLAAFFVFRLVFRAFQRQQARIDSLRAREEEMRAADMALARSIQRAELRTDGLTGDGYRLATLMKAAREVGGDFYDYYEQPDGRLVITIADVSGKGVPAAFFMMKARMTLKSCIYSSGTLAEAVAKANVRLAQNNPAEMFVTVWVGVYDHRTGTLDYVSAGHNPPLLCPARSPHEVRSTTVWLGAPRCAALGVFERAKYRAAQTSLAPGDRLFLYTDGVTEAMNAQGALFGNDRLEATLNDALANRAEPGSESGALIPIVSRALESFVADAEQSDDITMLELVAL